MKNILMILIWGIILSFGAASTASADENMPTTDNITIPGPEEISDLIYEISGETFPTDSEELQPITTPATQDPVYDDAWPPKDSFGATGCSQTGHPSNTTPFIIMCLILSAFIVCKLAAKRRNVTV